MKQIVRITEGNIKYEVNGLMCSFESKSISDFFRTVYKLCIINLDKDEFEKLTKECSDLCNPKFKHSIEKEFEEYVEERKKILDEIIEHKALGEKNLLFVCGEGETYNCIDSFKDKGVAGLVLKNTENLKGEKVKNGNEIRNHISTLSPEDDFYFKEQGTTKKFDFEDFEMYDEWCILMNEIED